METVIYLPTDSTVHFHSFVLTSSLGGPARTIDKDVSFCIFGTNSATNISTQPIPRGPFLFCWNYCREELVDMMTSHRVTI